MQITIPPGYTSQQCTLILEIIKAGHIIEQHETSVHKFIIIQRIYAHRGQVYLFIILNGKLITFEELKG